jgi:hypothetical protein
MSNIYRVFLKNLVSTGADWGEGQMYAVGMELRDLFKKVCQHPASSYASADYWWDPLPGEITDRELLVYFVRDQSESVIKKAHPGERLEPLKAGNTWPAFGRGIKISEVYVSSVLKYVDSHLLLARLCFHELMHNKLEPEINVHNQGGGGLATGGTIYPATELSETNKALMAQNLDKTVQQYIGAL